MIDAEQNSKEHEEIKEDVKEILRLLNGNGNMGFFAKVNVMWSSFIFLICTVAVQAVILTRILLS